ncbi:alpha/beta hydrolase [Orrella marina]|uniref:Carboxylesterase n=1 Tax=Orrella marina TaxID=2163011 RepID=A0A2R4XMY8_9BURK|nr:carboxylesterase [Orrella marina]AWB35172.1 carboxylesterase [Orrella marina]
MLDCIEIETGKQPTHSIIWMHGLGADGNDFAPLVPALNVASRHAIRFVFPNAPQQPVTINGGMVMPAWYDILVPSMVIQEDEAGILKSEQSINELIEREIDRGIAPERIVLAGFSQGCAMTLHTGLRQKHSLAGLMGLSGYLPLAQTAPDGLSDANRKTPIFLAHGTIDPVVTIDRGTKTRDFLESHGYDVRWHTYMMPHSVCPEEVADINAFLEQVLG